MIRFFLMLLSGLAAFIFLAWAMFGDGEWDRLTPKIAFHLGAFVGLMIVSLLCQISLQLENKR